MAGTLPERLTMTDVTGIGGTTFGALSSIGSDLSVSVSFSIASELLGAAEDEQLSEDELIGLVLGFAVVFSAAQSKIAAALARRRLTIADSAKKVAKQTLDAARLDINNPALSENTRSRALETLTDEFRSSFIENAAKDALAKLDDRRSLLDFLLLLVSIVQRISVAISVQLLAASVRAQQPSRLVRTVSLIGLASFFVFVESVTGGV